MRSAWRSKLASVLRSVFVWGLWNFRLGELCCACVVLSLSLSLPWPWTRLNEWMHSNGPSVFFFSFFFWGTKFKDKFITQKCFFDFIQRSFDMIYFQLLEKVILEKKKNKKKLKKKMQKLIINTNNPSQTKWLFLVNKNQWSHQVLENLYFVFKSIIVEVYF